MIENSHSEELERIKQEYQRRNEKIPSDYYSLSRPENSFMHIKKIKKIKNYLIDLNYLPMRDKKILDVGCGSGQGLLDFQDLGVCQENLFGIEIDKKRLNRAKEELPQSKLIVGDASNLPWEKESFDLVNQSTVFTSILNGEMKRKIASEMIRVLKKQGVIIWYDFCFNNPKNPNVRGVKKSEIEQLFPGFKKKYSKITLAPPITRALAPYSLSLCGALEKLKFLNTHYLAVLYKYE